MTMMKIRRPRQEGEMKIIIEDQDYINAVTPTESLLGNGFLGGCRFQIIKDINGDFLIEPGCYCLLNLLNGADQYIYEQWVKNGEKPYNINASPQLKLELLKMKPCRSCGGMRFEIDIAGDTEGKK